MNRGTNGLINGGLYELPNGHQVYAERPPGAISWFLLSPEEQRVYVIEAQGGVRLIGFQDGDGKVKSVQREDEPGVVTDFTAGDLRPV